MRHRAALCSIPFAARPGRALGQAPLVQKVRVYPALRTGEEQQIFLARSRQIDLQLRQARQRGLGRDFESLREYREGDDLRDICWTASARRGSLITRQYQTERSQPVWIVLDCGRLMRSRVARPLRDQCGYCRCPREACANPLQARPRLHDGGGAGAACAVLRRSCGPARLRAEHSAASATGTRRRASATDDRAAGSGARRIQRSRPPARHHSA